MGDLLSQFLIFFKAADLRIEGVASQKCLLKWIFLKKSDHWT